MPATPDVLPLFGLMHPDGPVHPAASHGWTFEPGVVVPFVTIAALYATGLVRVWSRSGIGAGVKRWQAASFGLGCTALAVALVSPVDALSNALSSVHMMQHELLMIVAAPLFVGGVPLLVAMYALPAGVRRATAHVAKSQALRTAWTAVTAPAAVWLLHAAAIWVWHLPALYEAALGDERLHAVQHASFFGTALLFWWGLMRGRYGRMGYGASVVYVFATALHTGVLGAALTLSPMLWYPSYAARTSAWGLAPLEDQQLAGLIMWVPAGVVFTAIGLVYFAAWLNESERRTRIVQAAGTSPGR